MPTPGSPTKTALPPARRVPSRRSRAAAKDGQSLQSRRAALTQAEESFRALTADDKKLAKPWKVALRPYPAGGFAEMAKASVITEAQLKLLNGRYGGEALPQGG